MEVFFALDFTAKNGLSAPCRKGFGFFKPVPGVSKPLPQRRDADLPINLNSAVEGMRDQQIHF